MQRRRFLKVLAAGGAALTLSACDDMPASAVAPWQGPDDALRDARLRALSWALLAPNPHNLQPWIADVRSAGEVSLWLDAQRLLPATDPYGRQILIGCGGFIEIARMAAAASGERVTIEPFPDGVPPPDQPLTQRPLGEWRVARLRWSGARTEADPLFAQVRQRRTNRASYAARVPDEATLRRVTAAVQTPGIEARFSTQPDLVARINALAAAAYRTEFGTPATFAESARVVRLGAEEIAREPSGIAVHGTAIWWSRRLGLMSRDEVFNVNSSGTQGALRRIEEAMLATPAWCWLVSADNSRDKQLAAGRAFVRQSLAATAEGLASHTNSQSLQEFVEMREHFDRIHALTQTAAPARLQMLTRLGEAPPPGPAPRRALPQVLRT